MRTPQSNWSEKCGVGGGSPLATFCRNMAFEVTGTGRDLGKIVPRSASEEATYEVENWPRKNPTRGARKRSVSGIFQRSSEQPICDPLYPRYMEVLRQLFWKYNSDNSLPIETAFYFRGAGPSINRLWGAIFGPFALRGQFLGHPSSKNTSLGLWFVSHN